MFAPASPRHAKVRLAAIQALRMTVKVPDRAKVKGAGTSAIVDLVGFREDNVLPVAAFYGRGDTTVNYLAEVKCPRLCEDKNLVGDVRLWSCSGSGMYVLLEVSKSISLLPAASS